MQCPSRVWVWAIDSVTGGAFHSSMYYTERCQDTKAWPDPTLNPETCLSFDPEVAVQCAFGFGPACQDCPRHARCPGGNRAWPMPGFWSRDETSLDIIHCAIPSLERCPIGFDVVNLTSPCGEGYIGEACRQCGEGYFQARDLRCSKCPTVRSVYESVVEPAIFIAVLITSIMVGLTLLTLAVIFVGIALVDVDEVRLGCRGHNLRKWTTTALSSAALFGMGLVSLLQIVASVVRPIPLNAPSWYAKTVSVLDLIFLDTGGFISSECLDGDPLASERRVLVGSLVCVYSVYALQVKYLRPERLWCLRRTRCKNVLQTKVTPSVRMLGFHAVSLLYGVASASALGMLTCGRETPLNPTSDGVLRLRSRPDLECYSSKDGTLMLSIISWFVLITFTVPWPIVSAYWVKRYYWRDFRGREKATISVKNKVYDFWIAEDNHLKPRFYWIRSLDSALLSTTALLTAALGNIQRSLAGHILRMAITCLVMLSFLVLILRVRPFVKSRLWARDFRIATLSIASLAAVLRFCDSDAVSFSQAQFDALAGVILALLVLSLVAAIIQFEKYMLQVAQSSVAEERRRESFKRELVKRFTRRGTELNLNADKKFLSHVRVSFQVHDNPLTEEAKRTDTGATFPLWAEYIDDVTGVPYFVHSVTGEAQWGAPDEMEDGEENSEAVRKENKRKEQNLDDGDTWDMQDDQGQENFVNKVSGESRWSLNAQLYTTPTSQSGRRPGAPGGGGAWEACVVEVSGETYFVNSVTCESRWQDPTGESNMLRKWKVNDEEPPAHETGTDASGSGGSWEACVDEVSGETYFVNSVLGESRWEDPTCGDHTPTEWKVNEEYDARQTGSNNNVFKWESRWDEQGCEYFLNSNGESRWDLPFEESVDEGTGVTYFVNLVTGEAQWHRPRASGGGDDEDEDEGEGVSRLTKTQAREIIRNGRCRVCEQTSCDGTATHGQKSDRLPMRCKSHVKEGDVVKSMDCEINPEGDVKSTKLKLTWLANWNELVPVIMKDFDYLITKRKPEETDEFKDIVNKTTEIVTVARGDGNLRAYNKGEIIQIERKGYFIVDRVYVNEAHPMILLNIPDGKKASWGVGAK